MREFLARIVDCFRRDTLERELNELKQLKVAHEELSDVWYESALERARRTMQVEPDSQLEQELGVLPFRREHPHDVLIGGMALETGLAEQADELRQRLHVAAAIHVSPNAS